MGADFLDLSAGGIAQSVREKRVSALETAQFFLEKARRENARLNAFLSIEEEPFLNSARELDKKIARGEEPGALAGVPVAVKDNLCVRGTRTTCASKILENYVAPYDATAVRKLRSADALLIGKTNLDEFAMGSSTENSAFGATRNPWDTGRVPGGSSGGSACAVAAGLAPLALGSDTGGSIRQPAGFCGVAGMKPTYGRVSRYGLVAFASSLDQIGPFARDAEDAALLLQAISGRDPLDSTSSDSPVPDYLAEVKRPPKGLTLGLAKEYFVEGLDPGVQSKVMEAVRLLEKSGARVKEVSLPNLHYSIEVYYILAPSEASANLARFDGVRYGRRSAEAKNLLELYEKSRGEGFGPEVKRRIMLGTYALSSGYYDAYYAQAQKVRTLICRDFEKAFREVDVLVTPTSPTPPFKFGEKADDPLQMYLSDIFTIACNLAGLPGISIPCGFSDGNLPVGLQFLGRPFEDSLLLQLSRLYQSKTDWHKRRPPLH